MGLSIQKLKEKYNLTLNEEETMIWVKPENKWEFTSCPLPENLDGCVLISMEDYLGFMTDQTMFTDDLKSTTDFREWTEEEFQEIMQDKIARGLVTINQEEADAQR